jgi:4-hydroxy-tetrahydrodipicolinate synthase
LKLAPGFLRGSYPPLVTPFRNGGLDLDAFGRLVEHQVSGGSHGIVVCGTTAEATSLSASEKGDLFRAAVAAAGGQLPVVAGAGGASLQETLELVGRAERASVDAVLVVTPYYVRPPQAGIVEYFVEVGKRTSLPLLIYHIPGRAAVSVTADTVARIAERTPNLAGIKHAAVDLDLVSELLLRIGPDLRVFCGLESLSLPMLAVGAAGVMNAVGNLVPARVAALCGAVAAGRLEEARRIHVELFELSQAIFVDTNPTPLKYMMARVGLLASPEVRLPLVPLDEAKRKTVDEMLRRAGLLERVAAGVAEGSR